MSKLVVISEGLASSAHELGPRWITIGRGDNNAFQIIETSVSTLHCEVLLRDNQELVVRDLRSTNGTFIDGKNILEGVLKPGQILRLGQVELCLEISAPASAPVPPAAPATADIPPPGPAKKSGAKSAGKKVYRVLFVDDSMAFLQMITDLFELREEKVWDIHTASTPDQALSILQQKLIDLVVLDIGMPLLDGVQLLSLVHQRYPNIKKVVLTGETDDNHRAECLSKGAELFLLKPGDDDGWRLIFNMLTSLLQWEDRDDFASELNDASLYNIIQLECLAGSSSIVEVRNQQTAGEIYIEGGAIVHAAAGKLSGEKALHQLMSITDGEFRLIPFRAPPERTIQVPWESLLMPAGRERDLANAPGADDETILVTKKRPAPKTVAAPITIPPAVETPTAAAPAPAPPVAPAPEAEKPPLQPAPAEPPKRKLSGATAGMDFFTLEELVEADTDVIPKPDGKEPPSDHSQN